MATTLGGTPVLIAATGGSVRHSLALEHALRPLFAYLRAVVVAARRCTRRPSDWGAADAHRERAAGPDPTGRPTSLAEMVADREPSAEADPYASVTPV